MVEKVVKEHIESLGYTSVPIYLQQMPNIDTFEESVLIRKVNTSQQEAGTLHTCEIVVLWKMRDPEKTIEIHDKLVKIASTIDGIGNRTTTNYRIHTVISGLPESILTQDIAQASLGIRVFIWYELKK